MPRPSPRSPHLRRNAVDGRLRVRAGVLAVVAQLCLVAEAAVLGHALLVPHTTCAEHGAIGHEATHATTPSTPASDDSGAAEVQSRETHSVEDEHCDLLGTQHTTTPLIFAAGLTGQSAQQLMAAPIEIVRASSVAQYRLAPKTSPPQV